MSAEWSMPVLIGVGADVAEDRLDLLVRRRRAGAAWTLLTPRVFWAVRAVRALIP